MNAKKPTGIIFCYDPNKNTQPIDWPALKEYVLGIPGVLKVWPLSALDLLNPSGMQDELRAHQIERIVLAGEQAGMYKSWASSVLAAAGKDPREVALAAFGEYHLNGKNPTEEAKGILRSLACEVPYVFANRPEREGVESDTLVIGGGIAGIQAALEIAEAGIQVHLLEKSGTIGGHMAMFDKTFPTLDCAACILTPKMVEVGQHPNIHLITYAELQEVSGEPGHFQARIKKKARRVNLSTCIGCGTCAEKCPSKVASEFDARTTLRKAIYIPFPQAVPNKYLIDEANCRYVTEGKCGVCVKVCPVDHCINLDEQDEIIELTVGNIIAATGFQTLDPAPLEQYGYTKYPNVITSLEFERLINASGPTGGNITSRVQDKKGNWIFTADSRVPESFALIHCVGSRNVNYHKYCSRVCCMYSLKLAHLLREKFPEAPVTEYYIDMRAFGKGYDEFYERIRSEGIHMVRGRTAKVEQTKSGKLRIRSEDILNDAVLEDEVDMVILAVGLEANPDSLKLAEMLHIQTDEHGWLRENHYNADPAASTAGGIHLAGVCQGPKDIPDTVAQASAAAARVIQSVLKNKVQMGLHSQSLSETEAEIEKLNTLNHA